MDELRRALPYLKRFRDKTFVVKCGGESLESPTSATVLLEQIHVLQQLGIRIVLVHGGGNQSSELAKRHGITPEVVDGRRVTSDAMIEIMIMALLGTVKTHLLALCRKLELPAIGLSGIDGGLITATRRPPMTVSGGRKVDFGCVGDIETVDTRPILSALESGYLPVVSPICCDKAGNILNINADQVAAAVAVALGAVKLILVTTPRGILRDPSNPMSFVSQVSLNELDQLEKEGAMSSGMLPKKKAISDAILGGVARVHVVSHSHPDSLLAEVFTNEGCGTLITPNREIEGNE